MRKHFLLLFLMALLPLAGWAQGAPAAFTNLANFHVEVVPEAVVYGGAAPEVRIVNNDDGTIYYTAGFNKSWSPALPAKPTVYSDGYTVTVTADNTKTYGVMAAGKNTAKFFVMKATDNEIVEAPVKKTPNPAYDDGNAIDLITNYTGASKAAAKYGDILYSINGGAWSSAKPTATDPGTYNIKYKVEETDNYNGVAVVDLGDVTITGVDIDPANYAAPVGIAGLEYQNGVSQTLISAGTVRNENAGGPFGTMMYRFKKSTDAPAKWSAYSTTLPAAEAAATYNIQWKIAAETGFYDIVDQDIADVTIAAIHPATVTSATGKTGLVYAGDATPVQALLETAGSASDGASVKYQVRYKADFDADWGAEVFSAAKDFADVKGGDAGVYQIKTLVVAGGNYLETAAASTIDVKIAKAKAFTSAPTAADVTWNNDDQELIVVGAGTVNGKVKYSVQVPTGEEIAAGYAPTAAIGWTTTIADIKGKRAGKYHVLYKVDDANYEAVAATEVSTTLKPVKIKKRPISVKVNDITKTYNNNVELATATVDGDIDPFTFITPITGAHAANDFAALTAANYVATTKKDAGSYADEVTVPMANLTAINADKNYDYEWTIVPGKLTINKREIYVEAKAGLEAMYGTAYDISRGYVIKDSKGEVGDVDAAAAAPAVMSAFFATAPTLTTDAAALNPEIGTYNLLFTAGATSNNYKMDLTKGENHDGYIIGVNKFTVTPDPDKKIVITVLPHTQKYTGVAESWAGIQPGVDYTVSGLLVGDELTVLPTFTRDKADKFIVGEYALTADGAKVADISKYPGGIVYNNSTFTIEPAELTATVNQQTVFVGGAALPNADAWSVEGLQNGEAKSVLNGVLALVGSTAAANEHVANGIRLTIANANYKLVGDNVDAVNSNIAYGTLRVIAAGTLELDPTDPKLAEKIAAAAVVSSGADEIPGNADDVPYTVTFANKTLKADTWYTMVLPFSVKATELVNSIKDATGAPVFTITNRLNEATTTGKIVFKLEMKEIPANEPFLIKTAEDVDLQKFLLADRYIKNGIPMTPVYDGNNLYGTYEFMEIQCPAGSNVLKWLVNEQTEKPSTPGTYYDVNDWKICRDYKAPINALEAYLYENRTVEAASAHPTIITVEDFDGQTTSIKTLNADTMKAYAAEGWYTLDGIKLQSAPTEKGIYINNGKKVVLK